MICFRHGLGPRLSPHLKRRFRRQGSTICYIGFEIAGAWRTDSSWKVTAPSHSYKGGGAASGVLSRDCDSYWNSAVTSSGPWNLTIDTGKPISPTGFEYSIFVPDEAPLAFAVEAAASADGPWHQVYATSAAPTGGCAPKPPPSPPKALPPFWSDPAIRAVNLTSGSGWSLGFAKHADAQHPGRTNFALCYNENSSAATACAEAAAAAGGVEEVMASRNEFILGLPPLEDAGDDRFQRKLLSVMKVNSMSEPPPTSQPDTSSSQPVRCGQARKAPLRTTGRQRAAHPTSGCTCGTACTRRSA